MALDLLKVAYIEQFCLYPWDSWPFQAFPANRFPTFSNKQLLAARIAWGFFEAVEAIDAETRRFLASQTVIGTDAVTDPNIWYELEIETTFQIHKYGQLLHSIVCPEISWNSQRHVDIRSPFTLQLLIPYPANVTAVTGYPSNKSVLVVWPASTDAITYTVTSNPENKSVVAQPGALSARITELTNGIPYTFTVTVKNSVGLTSTSAPSAPVVPRTNPLPPRNVVATAGFLSGSLTWLPPTDTGGGPVTYTIVSNPGDYVVDVSGLSGTVAGLEGKFTYFFTVTAINSFGLESLPVRSNTIVTLALPDPPSSVVAIPGPSSAFVTWIPPITTGAILSYTVSIGTQTQIVTDTSASFSGLTNGTSYTASVTATTGFGSSRPAFSNQVIPVSIPDPPTSVTASFQNSVINVAWTAANPQGSPVLSYTARLIDPSSNVVDSQVVTGLSTTFTTFIIGTPYTVRVSATNALGTSSTTVSNQVLPVSVPGSPLGLAIQMADSSATLIWSAPFNGGTAITGYQVSIRPGYSLQTQTVTQQTASFTGLINGSTYEFTVVAVNAVGASSPVSILGTPYAAPSVPTGVQAVPGSAAVTVSWYPPAYTGGSPLTSYTVAGSDASGNQLSTVTVPIYSPLAVTYTGLTNGIIYTFTVTVFTIRGSSSVTVSATPLTVPSPPTDLSGVNVLDAIVLTWRTPVTNGGTPIIEYMVSISPGCGIMYTTGLTVTFPDLIPGTIYTFSLTAINAMGSSAAGQLTMMHVTVPSVMTNINLIMGVKSASLTLRPPASTGGLPILSYSVDVLDPSGTRVASYIDGSATVLFTDLLDNTVYTFMPLCANAFGSSLPAIFTGITATIPSEPRSLAGTTGSSLINLTWVAPSFNGRTPILSYTVTTHDSNGTLVNTRSVTTLTTQITGLTNGIVYTFTVVAVNGVGAGPSIQKQFRPVGQPGPPQGLTITELKGTLVLLWTAPSITGGVPIAGYTITTNAAPVRTVTGLTVSYTGLTNGISYSFSIVSTNGFLVSTPVTVTGIPGAIPSAPLSLVSTRSSGRLSLTWANPSDTGGLPILGFVVLATAGGTPITTPTITVSSIGGSTVYNGLTNGTQYTITIAATNAKGSGPTSTISDTPGAPPSIPRSLTVTPSTNAILVSWVEPIDLGGFPITKYTASYTGGTPVSITNLSTLSYTFTNLTNGISYPFSITATNVIGTSVAATISGVPLGSPSSPVNLVATTGDSTLALTWTKPTSNGGAAITGYVVIVTNTTTNVVVTNPPINTTSSGGNVSYTGLTNGVTYSISVAAIAASTGSATTTTAKPGAVPGPPTSLTAAGASGQVTLTWSAPSNNGGFAITSYTVKLYDSIYDNVNSPYTISGLTNGGSYPITVVALNEIGTSAPAFITGNPIGTPTAVTNLRGTPANNSATISWNEPSDNGGGALTYRIYYQVTSGSGQIPPGSVFWVDTPQLTYVVTTGLVNGDNINFIVTANNGVNISPNNSIVLKIGIVKSVPGPVGSYNIPAYPNARLGDLYYYMGTKTQAFTVLTAINPTYTNLTSGGSEHGILMVWITPTTDGGEKIDYYQYIYTPSYGDSSLDNYSVPVSGEVAGTTVYALWRSPVISNLMTIVTMKAHNVLGFSTAISFRYFYSVRN